MCDYNREVVLIEEAYHRREIDYSQMSDELKNLEQEYEQDDQDYVRELHIG